MTITESNYNEFYTKEYELTLPNTVSGEQVGNINPQSLGAGQINNVLRMGKGGAIILIDSSNQIVGLIGDRNAINGQ